MLVIEADIHEYVRMSYVDKNILGPLVHMRARDNDMNDNVLQDLMPSTKHRLECLDFNCIATATELASYLCA